MKNLNLGGIFGLYFNKNYLQRYITTKSTTENDLILFVKEFIYNRSDVFNLL